jgi:hypothetical protein
VENDAAIGLGSQERVEQGSGTMRKVSDSEIMKRSEVAASCGAASRTSWR